MEQMPTIRQLPPSLINKIAAGEVIERPASVVKELLENSVDAGATSIELTIEGGGMEMIRISDNGCGIEAEQIPLAIASHATSKLETAEDLFDVHTLGFRGEALASISEVSHLTMRTRVASSDSGFELTVRGGEASPLQPVGAPVGTTIEVRNLFFNTPVRRKFLKTPSTEAGHITEAFTRIALAFPHVQMTMISGQRTLFDLAATDSWKDRIRAFMGDEIADALIAVQSHQETGKLSGYVADPSVSRSNNRLQYLFLNGRCIRDRSLQHALGEAYRGLLMVGRFPVCFLRLELPPSEVDVNVHPTKMEVRFQEGGKLYSQLLQTLRHQFLTTDLTARARHVPGPLPHGLRSEAESSDDSTTTPLRPVPLAQDDRRWQDHSERMSTVTASVALPRLNLPAEPIPPFRPFPAGNANLAGLTSLATTRPTPATPTLPSNSPPPGAAAWQTDTAWSADAETTVDDEAEADATHQPRDGSLAPLPLQPSAANEQTSVTPAEQIDQGHSQRLAVESPGMASGSLGMQIHNRYLITQDEHGMVVVDQHALHERILYEQLRMKTEQRALESQRLLVPEPIDLTPAEAAAALESKELLARIGIEIEAFGGDTVLMTSYPAMLARLRPAEVLRQVLEPLMAGGKEPSAREVLDELLHMLACKGAVKAGDRLAPEEITALLEQRHHYQDTHHCPHGRPTALFFSREQLDRMFKRT
jgi:DNA mismatch repair protein MutL